MIQKNKFGSGHMETDILGELSPLHLDILGEIGNIGAGNAVTALSKLMGRRVHMAVPQVNVVDFSRVADFVGGPDNIVVGILIKIVADIKGIILLLTEQKHVNTILSALFCLPEEDISSISDLDEIEISALMETGNILVGSYLTALSEMTGIKMAASVPSLCIDMAGAILSVPAIEFSKVSDKVLFIESVFKTEAADVSGYFIFIPEFEFFDKVFSALGVCGYE